MVEVGRVRALEGAVVEGVQDAHRRTGDFRFDLRGRTQVMDQQRAQILGDPGVEDAESRGIEERGEFARHVCRRPVTIFSGDRELSVADPQRGRLAFEQSLCELDAVTERARSALHIVQRQVTRELAGVEAASRAIFIDVGSQGQGLSLGAAAHRHVRHGTCIERDVVVCIGIVADLQVDRLDACADIQTDIDVVHRQRQRVVFRLHGFGAVIQSDTDVLRIAQRHIGDRLHVGQ